MIDDLSRFGFRVTLGGFQYTKITWKCSLCTCGFWCATSQKGTNRGYKGVQQTWPLWQHPYYNFVVALLQHPYCSVVFKMLHDVCYGVVIKLLQYPYYNLNVMLLWHPYSYSIIVKLLHQYTNDKIGIGSTCLKASNDAKNDQHYCFNMLSYFRKLWKYT